MEHSRMDKVLPEQKQRRRPRLAARSRWGNVNQGWDEQSVWVKWNCWHLISFHSPLWNNFSPGIFYIRVGLYLSSLVVSDRWSATLLSHKLFLVSHLLGCVLFLWTRVASSSFISAPRHEYRGRRCFPDWLKVVMWECVVIAVSTITILFFPEM